MISAKVWTDLVNRWFSLRASPLSSEQANNIRSVLNRKGYDDARATFAVENFVECGNREHPFDLLPHLLFHGDKYVPPRKAVVREREATESELLAAALRLIDQANDIARSLLLPPCVAPEKWTAPDEEALAEWRKIRAKVEGKTVDQIVAEAREAQAAKELKAKRDAGVATDVLPDTPESLEAVAMVVKAKGREFALRYFGRSYTNAAEMVEKAVA